MPSVLFSHTVLARFEQVSARAAWQARDIRSIQEPIQKPPGRNTDARQACDLRFSPRPPAQQPQPKHADRQACKPACPPRGPLPSLLALSASSEGPLRARHAHRQALHTGVVGAKAPRRTIDVGQGQRVDCVPRAGRVDRRC
eukprot:351879-Chlamydomonas_euryale.AAC.27